MSFGAGLEWILVPLWVALKCCAGWAGWQTITQKNLGAASWEQHAEHLRVTSQAQQGAQGPDPAWESWQKPSSWVTVHILMQHDMTVPVAAGGHQPWCQGSGPAAAHWL